MLSQYVNIVTVINGNKIGLCHGSFKKRQELASDLSCKGTDKKITYIH